MDPTTDSDWQLHPQLEKDCHVLGRLASALLLLNRNAALHWFILVPQTEVLDVPDLPRADREALFDDAAAVAGYLKDSLDYPRVNIAALGLVVPQLHLHVIGRRESDPCWPGPVWGALPSGPRYTPEVLDAVRGALLGHDS